MAFLPIERWAATLQGAKEASEFIKSLDKKTARSEAASPKSAEAMLGKFIRKASQRSIAMGKARIHMEEAVKRAEHILLDNKRREMASVASNIEKAEVIAQELHHKPGSLLTEKEFAHIYQITDCASLRPELDCSVLPSNIRTITGACNNLENPTQGSSFTGFQRLIPPDYADGLSELFNQADDGGIGAFAPTSPSARLVSNTTVIDRVLNSTNLTHLVVQWGQFMDHDLILSVQFPELECDLDACEQGPVCFPIRVPTDDKAFGVGTPRGGNCLPFQRAVPACQDNPQEFAAREQVNEITHYIDGSMVYGSTVARANFLREFDDLNRGRLKVSEGQNLPFQPPCAPVEQANGEVNPGVDCCFGLDSCFVAGDTRAIEHVSLMGIHTFWVREHNRIADALSALNPQWDEDRVFNEARDILIAEIQQVTYTDYLPAIFGAPFNELVGGYTGYDPLVDASIPNAFASAAYRFGHSQVQPEFARLDSNFEPIPNGPLNLVDSFFSQEEFFASADPTAPSDAQFASETDTLVRGLISQPARDVDEFVNTVLTAQLFEPANQPGLGMDLVTLNIQRGRDHGLPRYGHWKRFCRDQLGLESDFRNELTTVRLLQLYGDVDNADLFVGALAEEPLPGSSLGAVTSCIFSITFNRLRSGDRFFYENPDPDLDLFTSDQLSQIKQTSFSRIICDNTNLQRVQMNPFLQSADADRTDCTQFTGINFEPWRDDVSIY